MGVFAGYHQLVGGDWSGDVYIIPLRTMKENHQVKPSCRRISAKDIVVKKKRVLKRILMMGLCTLYTISQRNMERIKEDPEK